MDKSTQTVTDAAEFARQSRRAKTMFLDVIAGVVWTEMTMLHRKEHSPPDLEEEQDEFYDPYFGLGPRDIPLYIYKVLDSGIPTQPTLSRFRAGLTMFGIPSQMVDLYETFIKDFKGPDFNLLWSKLNRTMVTSDTGNYCSFHSLTTTPLQELDEDYVNSLNSFLRTRSTATDDDQLNSEDEEALEPVPVKPVGAIGGSLSLRREKSVGKYKGDAAKGEELRQALRKATADNLKKAEQESMDEEVAPPLRRYPETGKFTIGQQPGDGGEASGFQLGANGQILVGGVKEIKKEEVEVMEDDDSGGDTDILEEEAGKPEVVMDGEDSGGDTDILVVEPEKPAVVIGEDRSFPVPQDAIDQMNNTTLAQVVAAALSR